MHSILLVKIWYAFSLFTFLFASPIIVERQDENVIPWPPDGFNVPIGSPKQSWYIFYNGTACNQPGRAADWLNHKWLSMINQMIIDLMRGSITIREPIVIEVPLPVSRHGHDTGSLAGVLTPLRQNGVERDELVVAMRNLRQQAIEHVVFKTFLAAIYQGRNDLSATVFFSARSGNHPLEKGLDTEPGWDASTMNGNTTSLNLSPTTNHTYHQPSTDDTNAVQVAKRAPVSTASRKRPSWPTGRFKEPIGPGKDSWFDEYEATSLGIDNRQLRALWRILCDQIIQDMLDSPVDLVTRSFVHEVDSATFSQLGTTGALKVLFSPQTKGIEKTHAIAAMNNVKWLMEKYRCLAHLGVWMYEGQHDGRAYVCFYMTGSIVNGVNSSCITSLSSNLGEGLQSLSSRPSPDLVPAVDLA